MGPEREEGPPKRVGGFTQPAGYTCDLLDMVHTLTRIDLT